MSATHQSSPESRSPQPRIGISGNRFDAEPRRHYTGKTLEYVDRAMVERISRAGGIPIIVPVMHGPALDGLLALLDGVLLTGGADVDPGSYGQTNPDWPGQPARDALELSLIDHARRNALPILGVCRGIQILNVAFGGTLYQDLPTQFRPSPELETPAHRNAELYDQNRHALRVEADTWLADVLGGTGCVVNSVHHQGIDVLGDGLRPIAWAPDGLIEAVTAPGDRWTWAVQWHPEWDERQEHQMIFDTFVEACR